MQRSRERCRARSSFPVPHSCSSPLLALLLLLLFAGAPAFAQQAQPPAEEARRLLETFRRGDVRERRQALERLSRLGDGALPALQEALATGDPDLRFHVLFLLSEPFGRLDERLRTIALGREQNAATYPEALEAYRAIVADATPDTPRLLVHLLLRGDLALGEGSVAAVGLDLLRELTEAAASRGELTADDVAALGGLFEPDLGPAFYDLVPLFAAVPWELALPALRTLVRSGSVPQRIRAGRVLAEVAPPKPALHEVLPLYLPLLQAAEPAVRRAAIQALDLLPIDADAPLMPAVSLVLDPDEEVAREALRVVGERRLHLAREACEQLVNDAGRPTELRLAAARALGLLGDPGAAATLLPQADPRGPTDRRLVLTAAWALGAVGAEEARPLLERLIADDDLAHEEVLYRGLARLGAPGREALLALARPSPPFPRQRKAVDALRARAELAVAALGSAPGAEAIDALGALATEQPVFDANRPGVTRREAKEAIDALGDRREPEAAQWLGRILLEHDARGLLARDALRGLLEHLSSSGLPGAEDDLRRAVARSLTDRMWREGDLADLGTQGRALALVDPTQARAVLRRELERRAQSPAAARSLAWSLARAGDPGRIATHAIPHSLQELARAPANDRPRVVNNYGIDLLFGGRYREALVEFRRMLWCDPKDDTAAYNLACGYALLGDTRRAMHYLRRSVQLGFAKVRHVETDDDLKVLVGRPEFERLLRRMRLAVETTSQLPDMGPPR